MNKNYYLQLDPIQPAIDLMLDLKDKGYHVEILTGVPTLKRGIDEAGDNKREWVKKYMGDDIVINAVYRAEKSKFCSGKNCILIDDFTLNVRQWEAAGGTGILYRGIDKLKDDLREYGIEC